MTEKGSFQNKKIGHKDKLWFLEQNTRNCKEPHYDRFPALKHCILSSFWNNSHLSNESIEESLHLGCLQGIAPFPSCQTLSLTWCLVIIFDIHPGPYLTLLQTQIFICDIPDVGNFLSNSDTKCSVCQLFLPPSLFWFPLATVEIHVIMRCREVYSSLTHSLQRLI